MCSIFTFPDQPKDWDMSFPELRSFCWQIWIRSRCLRSDCWRVCHPGKSGSSNPPYLRALNILFVIFFQGIRRNFYGILWRISNCRKTCLVFPVSFGKTSGTNILIHLFRWFVVGTLMVFITAVLLMHISIVFTHISLWLTNKLKRTVHLIYL